jgi:hypothetical protein
MTARAGHGVSGDGISTLEISQQIRDFWFAYLASLRPNLTTMYPAPLEIETTFKTWSQVDQGGGEMACQSIVPKVVVGREIRIGR